MPCKITVQALGQTLVVSQPVSTVTGTAATAYTSSAVSVARTFPLTITADTDLWLASDGGTYTVVVSQPDGTQLITDPVAVSSAVAAVLSPMPTIPQLAADTSGATGTYGGFTNILSYQALTTTFSGKTDWLPAINAAIAAAQASGSREIVIPNYGSSYYFSAGWTIPTGVVVRGLGRPTLDFSLAPSSVVAITQTTKSLLRAVRIVGPGRASTATGIMFNGSEIRAEQVQIETFGVGWDGTNNLTYITTLYQCSISLCGLALRFLMSTITTGGEKIAFEDCTFGNCDVFCRADGSFLDAYFNLCSIDYITDYGQFDNGQYHFTHCHLETNVATTTQGYLFKKINGAKMWFDNMRFGLVGIPLLIDTATEGSSGLASYTQCTASFTAAGDGSSTITESEYQVFVASGSQTGTFKSPFISRTVRGSVSIGFHSTNPARSVASPIVSWSGTTATVDFGAAVTSNVVAIVRFG